MSEEYWKKSYGERSNEFINGVIAGIKMFAHWDNGVHYVGTTGLTLEKAIEEAKKGLGYID